MDDLHVAYLVLIAASKADGGCVPCVQGCVDEAMHEHPELPWEQAVELLRPESTSQVMAEAVESSRSLLASHGFPEDSCSYERESLFNKVS